MNLWKQVLDRLEQTIDRTQFETWFAPTRFLAQKGDTIDVGVPSQRFVSEIRQNYAQQIRSILDEMSTDHLNLHLVADTELGGELNVPVGPPPTAAEEPVAGVNARYHTQKHIVFTSDAPPKEIPTLEDRLRSRFEWGLIADIQPPDLETKVAILRKKADERQIDLHQDAALFIAERVRTNIRELEGLLNRIVVFASMAGQKHLSLELTKEALKELLSKDNKPITPTEIMRVVAAHYGTTVTNLKSKSNAQTVAFPRQVAMYLCKHLTDLSYPEIGRVFNNKHHSTVMYSVEKIDEKMQNDQQFARVLEGLMKQFR